MLQAIKIVRVQTPSLFCSSPIPSYRQNSSIVKLRQISTMSKQADEKDKDQKYSDVMRHSFGEAYATRSDEEGFGGIYGQNQANSDDDDDKKIHENHPSFDKSQGSEVKEKEKGRNSPHAEYKN